MSVRRAALLAAAALAAAATHADPAAWRVDSPSGGELWLLGSMHYLRADDYPLPAPIEALIDGADKFAMELDLDDLDPVAQQSTLLGAAMLPQGRVLADVLGAEPHARAAERAAALGVDLRLLERFEPWLVAIMLLDQGMVRHGYRAEHGLERYLLRTAQRTGKEILGLESLEAQLALFDTLPDSQQRSLLEQTLDELEKPQAAIEELAEAWRSGELAALAADLEAQFADFPGLYEALVTERNESWIPALERFLDEPGRHLVVVGALHLVGRGSVIELLETRGYAITRLP